MTSIEIFRAPMRARELELPQFSGARFGVESDLVGTGEPLEIPPSSESDAILAMSERYGLKAGRMLARFVELPDGTFVWTQTGDADFRLGKISGPWRYDDSAAARAVGILQVRPAIWVMETFGFESTPSGVIDTFNRGGKNFQRINDADAGLKTVAIWDAAAR